jgi:hypothetical protein
MINASWTYGYRSGGVDQVGVDWVGVERYIIFNYAYTEV